MPKSGHRHRLVIYTYMLNRWWRATLALGLSLLILASGLGGLPVLLPQFPFLWVDDWKLWLVGGAGGFAIFITIFLAAVRKSAYVQSFENHLRLVTPFLRLNISYRRFRRTYTDEFQRLFPLKKARGWKREMLEPLNGRTALVIEMTSFPVPRWALHLFLSPLFFPDRMPHLALLVSDWMALSTEMDSLRGGYQESLRPAPDQNPALQPAGQPQESLEMNIYFACSITGGREFEPVYQAITAALLADGHEVPTAHIAGADVKALEATVSPREVYERDAAWIRACDALVAEVSTPSHGVGYEIAFALNHGKRVLCLYREGRLVSKMITGNSSPNLYVAVYRDAQAAVQMVRTFLNLPSVDL